MFRPMITMDVGVTITVEKINNYYGDMSTNNIIKIY